MNEKRFNPSIFDSKHEVWDLLEQQAIIIEDLEKENEQLKKEKENLIKIVTRLKEKLKDILELTEQTGMIHLRKEQIRQIIRSDE